MRDPVCIVLNEREPSKARAAELLQSALQGLNITSSRLEVTQDVTAALTANKPSVVVLDYLLGDITTGLDVMTRISEFPEDRRPAAFFLTDEPSVPVAVEAMRLGALNYYELDNPQAVLKLSREIAHVVVSRRTAAGHDRSTKSVLTLDDLVAQADTTRRLLEQARVLIKTRPPVIAIYGPPGSGKSTLAHALQLALSNQKERLKAGDKKAESVPSSTLLKTVDLSLCTEPLNDLLGLHESTIGPRAFFELLAVIEQADSDTGELVELVRSALKKLPNDKHVKAPLIVCLHSSDALRMWQRVIGDAHCLSMPSLSERSRDIPALVQKFTIEATELSGEKVAHLDSTVISWIASLEWVDNCKQLKSVIIDTLLSGPYQGDSLKSRIEDCRALWMESRALQQAPSLNALSAAFALEVSNHNYRIAAARLGCSTHQLYQLINGERIA